MWPNLLDGRQEPPIPVVENGRVKVTEQLGEVVSISGGNIAVTNFPPEIDSVIKGPLDNSGNVRVALTAPVTISGNNWSFTQNVIESVGNSSTTNLSAGQSFTGSAQSTLGIAGIQVNLKTDQNCTILVQQGDGTNWDISDSFNYLYTKGGVGFTVQATNSYCRVIVTNTNSLSTTFFRLSTVLCPIVEALPRALSAEGNLKVGVYEMLDEPFTGVRSSPAGEMRITSHVRLAGATFAGSTLDPNFWTPTTLSGGSVTIAGGEVTLSTGSSMSGGSANISSVRTARYVASHPNYFRGVVLCPGDVPNCYRRWGPFDANDGYFFECNDSFAIVIRKDGVDTKVTTFNGDLGTSWEHDQNMHTYEVYWTARSAWWFVDGQFLHKSDAFIDSAVSTPHLKVSAQVVNGATSDINNTMKVRVMSISRLGELQTAPTWKHLATGAGTTVLKYGPGKLHRVTFGTFANGASVSLYDALSATNPISIIAPVNNIYPGSVDFGVDFYTGLTAVVVGTCDISVIYE